PILSGLGVAELGRLGDVAAAPDDDAVAALPDVGLLQVAVRGVAPVHPDPELVLVGAALGAHRAAFAADASLPIVGPGPRHRPSISHTRAVPPRRAPH